MLLTNGIAIYAVGVDTAAIPGMSKIDKLHIPGQGYTDILPKYANATGGDVIDSYSREAIESAYQTIPRRHATSTPWATPLHRDRRALIVISKCG